MHPIRTTVNDDVYFHAIALQTDWPTIPIMTVLVGILTICTGISLVVLVYRGLNAVRLALSISILVMYGGTVAYWALMLRSYSLHVSGAATTIASGSTIAPIEHIRTLPSSSNEAGPLITSINSEPAMRPEDVQKCTGTAALLVNITLGDSIVWWRAWVICARKRWIFGLAVILLLGTTVVGVTETAETCSAMLPIQLTLGSMTYIDSVDGAMFLGNFLGVISSIVTLLTNVVATALIGYQAWVHRGRMSRGCYPTIFTSRVGVRAFAVLALLIESGVLYCIVWAMVVAFEATLTIGAFDPQTDAGIAKYVAYLGFCRHLVEGALVPMIAIYPTVIIILVTLGNSCLEAATAHGRSDFGPSLPLFIDTAGQSGISPALCESPVTPINGEAVAAAPPPINPSVSMQTQQSSFLD